MKINPVDKMQPLKDPNTTQNPSANGNGEVDFATVLKQSTEKALASKMPTTPPAQGIQHPMPGLGFNKISGLEKTAHDLLDTLEKYQRVLANPSANLRQVQPIMDQMKTQANAVSPLVHELPHGHAIKEVIEETLMHYNKEIIRFNRGEYIDE